MNLNNQMQTEATYFMEPPNYYITSHIFDIDFHPVSDVIALSTISGEIQM